MTKRFNKSWETKKKLIGLRPGLNLLQFPPFLGKTAAIQRRNGARTGEFPKELSPSKTVCFYSLAEMSRDYCKLTGRIFLVTPRPNHEHSYGLRARASRGEEKRKQQEQDGSTRRATAQAEGKVSRRVPIERRERRMTTMRSPRAPSPAGSEPASRSATRPRAKEDGGVGLEQAAPNSRAEDRRGEEPPLVPRRRLPEPGFNRGEETRRGSGEGEPGAWAHLPASAGRASGVDRWTAGSGWRAAERAAGCGPAPAPLLPGTFRSVTSERGLAGG